MLNAKLPTSACELKFFLRAAGAEQCNGRVRDLYPCPLITDALASAWTSRPAVEDRGSLRIGLVLANSALRALNVLGGYLVTEPGLGRCAPQRSLQRRTFDKAMRMVDRLLQVGAPPSGNVALARLVNDAEFSEVPTVRPLVASQCALLARSGLVDPRQHVTPEQAAMVSSPDLLFPGLRPSEVQVGRVRRSDLKEYAKLVARQVRSGKVVLSDECFAAASVFTVGKQTTNCGRSGMDMSCPCGRLHHPSRRTC